MRRDALRLALSRLGLAELLASLGAELPVLAAPLAGGAGTTELVAAAARAGSLGFLGGGYETAATLAAEMAALRAGGHAFAVNLFAPAPLPVDRAEFERYAGEIAPEAERLGVSLEAAAPREDDDGWSAKIEVLLADPPPLVSFTFAIPPADDLRSLRAAGVTLAQTVTSMAEAELAERAGVDVLILQGADAGGHWGTFTPGEPPDAPALGDLLAALAGRSRLPLIAAGGVGTARDAAGLLAAGAANVMVGTALLLADEAGTVAAHRAALKEAGRESVVTRAFTGRPARGLRNGFIERHEPGAPLGYPAIHHLTSPLRRAAAAAGDPERLHLWAGTGFRAAREAPAGEILRELSGA
ncbi:MAG TPA: nitronate monooxygenase [Solirubrobacteraceae bacterium]|nr:nitronate monooxygenase [Solirubrobacteraceae bacterium]